MISNAAGTTILSSLGWVERNSLWILDTQHEVVRKAYLGTADYLSLFPGSSDYFSVAHHYGKSRIELTAHSYKSVETILSRVSITEDGHTYDGSADVWRFLPKAYVGYLSINGVDNYWLLLLDPIGEQVAYQQFDWFDDSYDKSYQGIIGVTEIPNSHELLVSIQRDSRPVLWDPTHQRLIKKLTLAGAFGNPRLRFRSKSDELWADDYDTLLRLNRKDWCVEAARRLQPAREGTSEFIGEFNFSADETLCIVPRPFSGDVLGVDTRNLTVKNVCHTGGQPLEAVMLDDRRVYARDWKTGDLLSGRMQRKLLSINLN